MTTNILLFGNAAMLGAATVAIIRFRRQARRFEKFWDSPTGAAIADTRWEQAKAVPIPIPDSHLEKRVTELQSVVRSLAKKAHTSRDPENNSWPVENAMRMAKHGASIDELIRNCGLNIGEAQLMRKLHGKSKAH